MADRDKFVDSGWVRDLLRYGTIGLVAPPGVSKFLTYSESVQFFSNLGIPFPEITVLLVGVIEIAAVVLLLLNMGALLVAVSIAPVMTVAFLTAGDWQALVVLIAVLGLLAENRGFWKFSEYI